MRPYEFLRTRSRSEVEKCLRHLKDLIWRRKWLPKMRQHFEEGVKVAEEILELNERGF